MDDQLVEPEIFIDFGEVPSALSDLTERVGMLRNALSLFRGWDTEIAELKSLSIKTVSNCKKDLRDIKGYVQSLQSQLECSREKMRDAQNLKNKIQFILHNVPDRFNCPSNVAASKTETSIDDVKPGLKSSALNAKAQPVFNIPEVPFLTVDEFEKVPKYLKGRVTYEKINVFIELLNKVLATKYAIFKKKKSTLKKKDADLWNEYNKQELKETKGLYFCVANDFKNLNGSMLDKTCLNMLTILRHCGRIRELRTGGILRYVAMF